jgi:RNA-directed DNA polymerase
MQRANYLIEPIADRDNLYLAYYKAQKGKGAKQTVFDYGKNLNANLELLQSQILRGAIEVGDYHYFTIYDPKERIICAAPFAQRVLHHALMNICHPYFERAQIFDSYASRIGKGTYAALERAQMYNRRYRWFLKLDFRKYFDSLDHQVLKTQLERLFKDKALLTIFNKIIDSYAVNPSKGVPIGNLTSQYFANHYLSPADHFVKESLKIPAYVRYMDDMILWHDDKATLLKAGYAFQKYTEGVLRLSLKPFCLNQNTEGLPFLSYLLFPNEVKLAQRSRHRFVQKIKIAYENLELGIWSQKTFQNHIIPLIAFTEHAEAKGFRQTILKRLER